MNAVASTPLTPAHLALLGTVVFLANAGLLVLQLLAGRYLAPFIGSSVETWTAVIGVFLTGIALGNHFGGKIADRSPTTRTLGILLLLGAASSLTMMLGWMLCNATNLDQSIPLGPRIPLLALLFCFLPGFVLSLLTPLTIKLMLADVSKAGRVSGIVFAVSTLGCLFGNYATGFWLMANFTLNVITIGVVIGLCVLALPMLVLNLRAGSSPTTATSNNRTPAAPPTDDPIGFRTDIRRAFAVVFMASFCGMSLELTASRILAPVLGVSLYTWTGIIGVMLAGTACGNYLGGVIADRGPRVGIQRLMVLVGFLVGFAATPAFLRSFSGDGFPEPGTSAVWVWRIIGALVGSGGVITLINYATERTSKIVGLLVVGAGLGYAAAHPVARAMAGFFNVESLNTFVADASESPASALLIHAIGAILGAVISLGLGYDPQAEPKANTPPTSTSPLVMCLFGAALFAGLIVILAGMFQRDELGIYRNLMGADLVWNVLTWTFLLFFLPMLCLGMISPQVIRLSVTDTAKAGRTAGTIYAWSTAGAIAGTFTTGFFLIGLMGMNRVIFAVALILLGLTFVVGRLWKNSSMLFVGSIIFGGTVVGLIFTGFGQGGYTKETKYYAIKVRGDDEFKTLALDLLIHSYVKPNDPTWLGYQHEEIQGELARHARSNGPTDVLVIGGGGYTFPRWMERMLPDVHVDVVEIDPGVTEVAQKELGLDPNSKTIHPIHMDGRQFVREKAKKGHYKLVMQDAVNDLSVPYHLLTKEYNEAVKATLAPEGAYLLTIIDSMEKGQLWRAAMYTMLESFKYVEILDPSGFHDDEGRPNTKGRHVYVIYGADHPLALGDVRAVTKEFNLRASLLLLPFADPAIPGSEYFRMAATMVRERKIFSHKMDQQELEGYLQKGPKLILTDQYAPVDNLMGKVFLDR